MSTDDATTAANDRLADREDMIVCVDVDKFYGDFQALKGVTATIKEGEVAVICGPSGSGKSTWIRCINRLEIHQGGDIVVDGIELTNDLRNIEKIRSEVGMVFQQFNLWSHMTVLENVWVIGVGRGAGNSFIWKFKKITWFQRFEVLKFECVHRLKFPSLKFQSSNVSKSQSFSYVAMWLCGHL